MPKAKPLTIADTIARLTRVGDRMGMDTPVTDFRMDTVKNGSRTRWVPKVPQAPRYRVRSGSGTCTGDHRCTGTDVHMTGCPVLIEAVESTQRQPVMVG